MYKGPTNKQKSSTFGPLQVNTPLIIILRITYRVCVVYIMIELHEILNFLDQIVISDETSLEN